MSSATLARVPSHHDHDDDENVVAKVKLTDADARQDAITELQHQVKVAEEKGFELEMVLRKVGPKRRKVMAL